MEVWFGWKGHQGVGKKDNIYTKLTGKPTKRNTYFHMYICVYNTCIYVYICVYVYLCIYTVRIYIYIYFYKAQSSVRLGKD